MVPASGAKIVVTENEVRWGELLDAFEGMLVFQTGDERLAVEERLNL